VNKQSKVSHCFGKQTTSVGVILALLLKLTYEFVSTVISLEELLGLFSRKCIFSNSYLRKLRFRATRYQVQS